MTDSTEKVQLYCLLSAWGTGSSAMAGYLDHCGLYTCPPHWEQTGDERTPNTFESLAYKDLLQATVDQATLRQRAPAAYFAKRFAQFLKEEKEKALDQGRKAILLKHPLQTFLLPEIEFVGRPNYIVLTRPFERIELTRRRRRWPPELGSLGAETIYQNVSNFLINFNKSALTVPFEKFRQSQLFRDEVLKFYKISPNSDQLQEAESFLR